MGIIAIELIAQIKKYYPLHWYGVHGVIHWNRVYQNGIKLAEQNGVNTKVVQLFSVFHDSQRLSEGKDPNHGNRGAQLALRLRDYLPLNNNEFELLVTACSIHTNTLTHEDISIQVCMDSDRLDLGRVGHYPDPSRLCTPMAKKKETIEWAYHRSLNDNKLPDHPFGLSLLEEE